MTALLSYAILHLMPRLYTLPEAAKIARCHPDTLRRAIKRKALPDRRVPGAKKYLLLATDFIRTETPNEQAA